MKNAIIGGLLDFQIGEQHDEVPFDPRTFIKAHAGVGTQHVDVCVKDAYGNAYYKSALIAYNRAVNRDLLTEFLAAGQEFKVDIHAYYNVLLDDKVADQYPQWRMIDEKGDQVIAYRYYRILCMNSPYRELVQERVADLVKNYAIGAIFFDITYFQPNSCYCAYCQQEFAASFGYSLPRPVLRGSQAARDFYQMQQDSRERLLLELRSTVKEEKDIPVYWNGSGSMRVELAADGLADMLSTEFHAPAYIDGTLRAKYMRSRQLPFSMTIPHEIYSWGDWTVNTAQVAASSLAAIFGNGGGVQFNNVPIPSGEFANSVIEPALENARPVFSLLSKLDGILDKAETVPDIAVYLSFATKRQLQWALFHDSMQNYAIADLGSYLRGTAEFLLRDGLHFDLISEHNLAQDLAKYALLVLPYTPYLPDEVAGQLRDYVKNGGKLLLAGSTGLYTEEGSVKDNFALAEVMGVDFQAFSPYSVDYYSDLSPDLGRGIPDSPVLLKFQKSQSVCAAPRSARRLGTLTWPPFESDLDRHVYHEHAHPYQRSPWPALTINSYGQGSCLWFASDLCMSYQETASPWLKRLFNNALALLQPEPVVRLDAPKTLTVSLLQKDKTQILTIVNFTGSVLSEKASFMDETIPLYDLGVRVKGQARLVKELAGEVLLPSSFAQGYTHFQLPRLDEFAVILLEF